MVKNTFLLIFSDQEIVFSFFTLVSIFAKNYLNVGFHGNQIGDMVPNYW